MIELNMENESFLVSLQLSDSSMPIGRYVHSNGLEGLLEELPDGPVGIVEVMESVILQGPGQCDAIAAAHAHRAFTASAIEQLHFIDSCLLSTKLTTSSRVASISCGRQLAKIAARVWPHEFLEVFCGDILSKEDVGTLAVMSAAVCASRGIDIEKAVLSELRGAVSGLMSAAVRLGRIGPTDAQLYINKLIPTIIRAKDMALSCELEDVSTTTFELDIAMMQLQRNPLRLFAT